MKENTCSRFSVSSCAIRIIFFVILAMTTGCGDDSDNDDEVGAEELTAPTLSSPANGALVTTANPTVSWSSVPGATIFELEVSTSSDFNDTIFVQQLPVTSFMISDFPINEGIHFWRVRAQNAVGVLSPWSNVFSFTVILKGPGGTPVAAITHPSENTTIYLYGRVDFEGSVTGGDEMKSCLWDFGSLGIIPNVVDPPAVEFANEGTYTVRFSAVDVDGDESSDDLTITVVDEIPNGVEPIDGYVSKDGSVEFSWSPMSIAKSYVLRIETANPIEYALADTSKKVSGLSEGSYIWCVYGVDSEGNLSRCPIAKSFIVELP